MEKQGINEGGVEGKGGKGITAQEWQIATPKLEKY